MVATTTTTNNNTPKLSLWLLPPKPLYTTLQNQITNISKYSSSPHSTKKYPNFMPHITILGGIPYPNVQHEVDKVLKELREGFCNFGGIECEFDANPPLRQPPETKEEEEGIKVKWGKRVPLGVDGLIGVVDNNNNDDDDNDKKEEILQWNQCCVALAKRTPTLMNAIRLSHSIFHPTSSPPPSKIDDGDYFFKGPIHEPHYSFLYGMKSRKDFPKEHITKLPQNFVSEELVLMWTYPACVEGVEEDWEEVGRIYLLEEEESR